MQAPLRSAQAGSTRRSRHGRERTVGFVLRRVSTCPPPRCRLRLRATSDPEPSGAGDSAETAPSEWKLPLAGSDTDWREFRARLVAGEAPAKEAAAGAPEEATTSGREDADDLWAHPIAQPERGCLLLAHPLMFTGQQTYFNQAVILVIGHDEKGTAGIILNKPMEHLIGQLSGAEALMPEFSDNRLFLGGDVGGQGPANVMQLLHGHGRQLENCAEVLPGVYLGGFQAAKMAVRQERLPASDFRWYCRYAGWAPGQLAAEVEKGVWFVAAASPGLVLHPSSGENGRRHWHTLLRAMGGEYAQLSEALLVDEGAREAVWGRPDFLPSSQGGVRPRPPPAEGGGSVP